MLSVREINDRLVPCVETLCRTLLPNGVLRGNEWEVGSIDGESGKSMKVCVSGSRAGVWSDFATGGDHSGDLIDLIMQTQGVGVAEAVTWAKDFLGLRDDYPELGRKNERKFQKPTLPNGVAAVGENPVAEYCRERGISDATLQKYGVGSDGLFAIFPYTRGGELVMFKKRHIQDKGKTWTSENSEPCLFGWDAIDPKARSVILTEGEWDALTYAEQGYPALSVPYGGGGGNKQRWIEYEFDRLQAYDAIYVSMDNDEEGQAALKEILSRLGAHRVLVPDLKGHKDANDAHVAGVNLGQSLAAAYSIDPEELRNASEFHDEIMHYLSQPLDAQGAPLPWQKTHTNIRIRTGEVSVWFGMNGHGKTQALGQLCVHNAYCEIRTCVASLEMRPEKLLSRQYRQICGTNQPSGPEGFKARKLMVEIWIFNVRGTAKAERILEVFEYAKKRYGVQQFIIDNLSKCGFGEDDYNGQKGFIDRVTDFAVANDVHVHVVVHSRKADSEAKPPNKMDVKGTGSITDMVDNVFSVWRNKPKEERKHKDDPDFTDSDPDCVIGCHKQRNGEWEGPVSLWFDQRSLQFTDSANRNLYQYLTRS